MTSTEMLELQLKPTSQIQTLAIWINGEFSMRISSFCLGLFAAYILASNFDLKMHKKQGYYHVHKAQLQRDYQFDSAKTGLWLVVNDAF